MSGSNSQPRPSSVPIVRLSTNQPSQNHIFIRTTAGAPIKVINKTIQSNSQIRSPIVPLATRPQASTSTNNPKLKTETSLNSNVQKSGNVLREMCVRVPTRKDRKFSVLRFHEKDKIDFSSNKTVNPVEVFMQRENNLKHFKNANNIQDAPTKGAGSEFGKEARQEARMKKYGVNKRQYKPDDQPWLMTVGKGKTAKRYRGAREGTVSDNVDYYLFCQTKDGNFDAYPIQDWYKMNPEVNYRFLKEEEAEAEYSKLNKTLNLFNIMVQRKLGGEDDKNDQDKESTAGTSSDKKIKKNSRQSFKLTDLDDLNDKEEVEDEADDEKDDVDATKKEEEKNTKEKKKNKAKLLALARKRRGTKRQRRKRHADPFDSSEDDEMDYLEEAQDESDPDDHMGDEVDYMTNSSSDEEKMSEEEREKLYEVTGVDEEAGLKALLTDLSEDEEENEKEEQNQSDKQDENINSDGNESDSNRPSGSSKRKNNKRPHSNSSDDDSSDKGSTSSDSSTEASDSSDFDGKNEPDAKISKKSEDEKTKIKNQILKCNLASDLPTSSPSVKVDPELMAAVAKYLKRKPITLTELMKKIKMKKLLAKNQNYDVMLAEVLKQLRPIKDMINGQNVLYLK